MGIYGAAREDLVIGRRARRSANQQGACYSLSDEIDRIDNRNQAGLMTAMKKFSHGPASDFAVVDRPLVDVHSDELVGQLYPQAAPEL